MRTELIIDDNTVYEIDLDCLYKSRKNIQNINNDATEMFSMNNIDTNTKEEECICIMTKGENCEKKEMCRLKWISILLLIYLFNQ